MLRIILPVAASLVAASLVATSAFAFPAVGDKSVYVGTIGGGILDYRLVMEITGYDSKTREYTVSSTTFINGDKVREDKVQTPADRMTSRADVRAIIAGCEKAGGVRVTMPVPAGSYEACKMETDKASETWTWFADVPFGYVRQTYYDDDDDDYEMDLQDFANGK